MVSNTRIPRGTETRLQPRPRLVLFDLDDTLCDYQRARQTRLRYALEPYFSEPEQLERALADAVARVMDGAERFEEVLAAYGIDDPDAVRLARERFIEDRYRGLRLFDEVLEVIAAVKRVAKVGLITNGPTAIQRPKIELLAIGELFPVLLISEEAGVWKPDPAIFHLALDAAGAAPREAIFIGDSPHHDVPGARAAGITAVWMNRAGIPWPGGEPPDVEIRDLYELLPLIGLEQPA